jgi:serine/threonine-protein kinase
VATSDVLPSELEPGRQIGAWRVVRSLGRGGMSEVFEVDREAAPTRAALKVLLRETSTRGRAAERFALEARVLQELGHRGVPAIYELGTLPDGLPYLVMELVNGITLAEMLRSQPPSRATSLRVLDQLCDVLAAAHARGIVHRDIKPENIIVVATDEATDVATDVATDGVTVKLLDWGIAKRVDDHAALAHLTSTGAIVGTPRYLAPEQARSEPVDARTDVYALGLLAYELLLGVYPFEAENLGDMLLMQMIKPPPSPCRYWPEIPATLERMLLAMLAKDPQRRPHLAAVHRIMRAATVDTLEQATIDQMLRGELDRADTIADAAPTDRATSRWRRLRR